jgi:hypothetical protein
MLDFLKLEKTTANIDLITGLGNAECLFQDLEGRTGILQFDAVFADIVDIFSTTPVDKSDLPMETPAVVPAVAAAANIAPRADEAAATKSDEPGIELEEDGIDDFDMSFLELEVV